MPDRLQKHFRISLRETRLLAIFTAFSIFCAALLLARMEVSGRPTYRFLIWNLFLAWLPLGLAAAAARIRALEGRWLLLIPLLALWLLFFPNAPYILTDLVHLRARPPIPLWFDILLILSFAIHGLLLGLASLHEVHQLLLQRIKPLWTWTLLTGALLAAAYGVYLGRYLRWNSWDILQQPQALLHDVLQPLMHPFQHKESIAMTLGFAALMGFCYLAIRWINAPAPQPGRRKPGA